MDKESKEFREVQVSWTKGLETLIETKEKKYSQEEKGIASRTPNMACVV